MKDTIAMIKESVRERDWGCKKGSIMRCFWLILIVATCQLSGYTYSIDLVISAGEGDTQSQYELGACYDAGYGTDVDKIEAVRWYTKAADKGQLDAQYYLGWKYKTGEGVAQSDTKAIALWEEAAASDHLMALTQLGLVYFYGQGVVQDYAKSFRFWLKAAELGYRNAQCCLGMSYFHGYGCVKDHAEAFDWYKRAADQSYAEAEYAVGLCYDNSYGVEKNEAAAFEYYLKAAKKGHTKAQAKVSFCYENGKGVTESVTSAEKWLTGTKFKDKAEEGDPEAQYLYGLFLSECCNDEETAIKWLRKSHLLNYAKASFELGKRYLTGGVLSADYIEALKLFEVAANGGVTSAKYYIGQMYYNGLIDPESERGAIYWLNQAADDGSIPANYLLGQIYSEGTGIGKLDIGDLFQTNHKKVSGIIKNDREAIKYFKRAAAKGHHNAQLDLADTYYNSLNNDTEAYFWLLIANAHEFDPVKQAPSNLLDLPSYNRKLLQGDWLAEVGEKLPIADKMRIQDRAIQWLKDNPGADKNIKEYWWRIQ